MTEPNTDPGKTGQSAEQIAADKAAAEALAAKGQSGGTPGVAGQPEGDLKAQLEAERQAREKAENQFKEYQRGITPKLEKLAEIEKSEQVKFATRIPDEIAEIDGQIIELDKAIFAHKNHRNEDTGEPEPLYSGHLEIQKKALERDKRNAVKSRDEAAFQGKYTQISADHPEFTDFNGLNAIILEYHKKDERVSPIVAYDIYVERQKAKTASSSAQITAENKELGNRAAGQGGGKPIKPDEPTEGEKERKRLFGV